VTELGRLTPHQTEVWDRFCSQWHLAAELGLNGSAVLGSAIGSKGAVAKLIAKGYVELDRMERGPMGGERPWYSVTTEAITSGAVSAALDRQAAKRAARLAEG